VQKEDPNPSMTGRQADQSHACMVRQSVVELGQTAGRIVGDEVHRCCFRLTGLLIKYGSKVLPSCAYIWQIATGMMIRTDGTIIFTERCS